MGKYEGRRAICRLRCGENGNMREGGRSVDLGVERMVTLKFSFKE